MTNAEIKIYRPDLGVDGTIPELLDWSSKIPWI